MDEVEFTIKCKMPMRWVPYFAQFLYRLERNGNHGHSEIVGFMSDGDGDFRPKFEMIDYKGGKLPDFNGIAPYPKDCRVDVYDAG